jgi:hypothetical protein
MPLCCPFVLPSRLVQTLCDTLVLMCHRALKSSGLFFDFKDMPIGEGEKPQQKPKNDTWSLGTLVVTVSSAIFDCRVAIADPSKPMQHIEPAPMVTPSLHTDIRARHAPPPRAQHEHNEGTYAFLPQMNSMP